jgi:WD40 repeat protein
VAATLAPETRGSAEAAATEPTDRSGASPAGVPVIAGYEILGELGRGGMGVVYKAKQVRANRLVALKMILAGPHAVGQELARFRAEAEAVARLQHPHIVQVFDVGEQDGLPYFSLEFCPGGTLADRLDGTPWPGREAARMIETLARAIHAAHHHGIVHRDLKPANVLLSAEGEPKITDFGLAKKLEETGQTQAGAIMGTPSYMAPEQAQGKSHEIGPAADVYALGAILYELLTGRPPFKGPTVVDTVMQVVADEPVPPTRLAPRTPRDLETIGLKCLQKDAKKRYASAEELSDDLHRFLEGEPVRARPVGALGRLIRWARRRPAVAALLALVVLITAVGAGMVTWKWLEAKSALHRAVVAEAEARETAKEEQKRACRLALDRGLTLCEAGETGRGLLWLAHALKIAPPDADDLQRIIRINLASWSEYVHPLRACLEHDDTVTASVWAGNGKVVVTGCRDKKARVWHAATGKLLHTLEHPGSVLAVACSPDGQTVVTGCGDKNARLWSIASGEQIGKSLRHARPVNVVAFSPDSKLVATSSQNHLAHVWDAQSGARVGKPLHHEGMIFCLAFSPDSKKLACGGGFRAPPVPVVHGSTIALLGSALDQSPLLAASALFPGRNSPLGQTTLAGIWDVATGKRLGGSKRMEHQRPIEVVAFSPDGKWLATASRDGTAQLWDARTAQHVATLEHDLRLSDMVFHPTDATKVLTGSMDGTAQLWDAVTGKHFLSPFVTGSWVSGVGFSPDGERLVVASADGVARLHDAGKGDAIGPPLRHPVGVSQATFDPVAGKTLLTREFREGGKVVRLWGVVPENAPIRCDLRRPRNSGVAAPVLGLAYSPDGKFFLAQKGNEEVFLHETATWKVIQRFHHGPGITRVAWRPDSKMVATGSVVWPLGTPVSVRLWHPFDGKPCGELKHPDGVNAVAFSPDGKFVLTGCHDGRGRIWEVDGTKQLLELSHREKSGENVEVVAVAWSPDGKTVLTGAGDATARFWDADSGKQLGVLRGHQLKVQSVAWSPDGETVATGGWDQTVRLWDVRRLREGKVDLLTPPLEHRGTIATMEFSQDSRILVTGCNDRKVRFWDVKTGLPAAPVLPHPDWVGVLSLSPDRKFVLTGCRDKRLRIWPMPTVLAVEGDVEAVLARVQTLTGLELDQDGVVRVLSPEAWHQRRVALGK